jgi:hypothetical protein
VSSDQLHPADFLAELASAIKAVRERGGKWNKTADTIQWANDRIVRLEAKLDEAKQMAVYWKGNSESLVGQLNAVESRLDSARSELQAAVDRNYDYVQAVEAALKALNGGVVERQCPKDGCPYVNGPDFSIGNPCRCDEPGDGLGVWRHNT